MTARLKILLSALAMSGGLGALQIVQCSRSKAQRTAISQHVDLRRAEARLDRPVAEAEARTEATGRTEALNCEVRAEVPPPVPETHEVTDVLVDLADRINGVLGAE